MTAKAKFIFIGVSTAGSSIMKIFPQWASILGLNAEVRGCDLPLRAPAAIYRRTLQDIIDDPAIKGALITAHKIDLLKACRDDFNELDDYARLCDEVSCIVKRKDRLLGFAKDPLSSALALEHFVPQDHWKSGERDILCLGAGGAAIAISVCMAHEASHPRRFLLTDISPERLASIRRIHERLDSPVAFEYHLTRVAAESDALLHDLPPRSLVINATGLGKDRPGSPLSDTARFPQGGLVWELNYRGERDFMRAAIAQSDERNLTVEDGWNYFLQGWTQVIAEVFDIQLARETFGKLSEAASALRPQ